MTMYRFDAELWLHAGEAAWCFVTLPEDASDDIEARTVDQARGFGSVRVRVTVGATTWATSVFPDSKRGAYVLPMKKTMRKAEGLQDGDVVSIVLALVDLDGFIGARGARSVGPRLGCWGRTRPDQCLDRFDVSGITEATMGQRERLLQTAAATAATTTNLTADQSRTHGEGPERADPEGEGLVLPVSPRHRVQYSLGFRLRQVYGVLRLLIGFRRNEL